MAFLYGMRFFKYDDRHDILFLIFHCSFSERVDESGKEILFSAARSSFRSSSFSRERGRMFALVAPNPQQMEALPPPRCECFQQKWEGLSVAQAASGTHTLWPRGDTREDIPILHLPQGTSHSPATSLLRLPYDRKTNCTQMSSLKCPREMRHKYIPVAASSGVCEATPMAAPEPCLVWGGQHSEEEEDAQQPGPDQTKTTMALPSSV